MPWHLDVVVPFMSVDVLCFHDGGASAYRIVRESAHRGSSQCWGSSLSPQKSTHTHSPPAIHAHVPKSQVVRRGVGYFIVIRQHDTEGDTRAAYHGEKEEFEHSPRNIC